MNTRSEDIKFPSSKGVHPDDTTRSLYVDQGSVADISASQKQLNMETCYRLTQDLRDTRVCSSSMPSCSVRRLHLACVQEESRVLMTQMFHRWKGATVQRTPQAADSSLKSVAKQYKASHWIAMVTGGARNATSLKPDIRVEEKQACHGSAVHQRNSRTS